MGGGGQEKTLQTAIKVKDTSSIETISRQVSRLKAINQEKYVHINTVSKIYVILHTFKLIRKETIYTLLLLYATQFMWN